MYSHHSERKTEVNTPGAQPYSHTIPTLSSSQKMIPILTSITLDNFCQSLKSIYLESCSMYCVWSHILNLMFMKFVDVTTYNSSLYILTMIYHLILAKKHNILYNGWWVFSLLPGFWLYNTVMLVFDISFFFLFKDIFIIGAPVLPRHWMRWYSVSLPSTSLLAGFSSPQSLLHSPKPYPCLWHFFKEDFYWSFKYRNVLKAYWITV